MKTNVAQTSIQVYHDQEVQAMMQTQFQKVAAYVVEQAKHGKPCCIGSIWEHFAPHGSKGLGQKGTVSRVCNDLARPDAEIIVNGRHYRFEAVAPRKYGRNVVKHFTLKMIHQAPEGVQSEMF